MRILLDEGMPLRAAAWLRERGVDAIHAREAGLAGTPDSEILAFAVSEQRLCVTLDHDFHSILAETFASRPSVILIRTQQTGFVETAELVLRLISNFGQDLESGVALTAGARGVRLRRLPLR